jgi:ubiquinone/menaquinone biosynthesis C-methylase UbiE
MERIPEPELMDEPEQARAYAAADFEEPHSAFVAHFAERFPEGFEGTALDLGCGPADITLRFARAYPHCRIDGVDGARSMLRLGEAAVHDRGLVDRVRLIHGRLPDVSLPEKRYDAGISNSLLHHLAEPLVLWHALERWIAPGAPVFIMDLMRPSDRARAEALVEQYSGAEPAVLRRDFFNSLLAAYRVDEVRRQLQQTGLGQLQAEAISDRHWVVWGRMPGA